MKKKLIWLCIHTLLFSAVPDSRLLDYQQRYSLCHGRTDYQIAKCLINGGLNFTRFRGDRNIYRHVSKKKIKEAVEQGNAYAFTMQQIPRRESYTQLLNYLDYLYSIKDLYTPPRFAGDKREDIIRIKRVFNLLQAARLEETPEPTPEFKAALLEYQRRHGLSADGKIGPRTKRALRYSLEMLIEKVKKNLTLERITREKEDTFIVVNIPEYKRWITLKEEIPVYIEYHTVWVDDEGIVQFRPDIYGYEKKFFK